MQVLLCEHVILSCEHVTFTHMSLYIKFMATLMCHSFAHIVEVDYMRRCGGLKFINDEAGWLWQLGSWRERMVFSTSSSLQSSSFSESGSWPYKGGNSITELSNSTLSPSTPTMLVLQPNLTQGCISASKRHRSSFEAVSAHRHLCKVVAWVTVGQYLLHANHHHVCNAEEMWILFQDGESAGGWERTGLYIFSLATTQKMYFSQQNIINRSKILEKLMFRTILTAKLANS